MRARGPNWLGFLFIAAMLILWQCSASVAQSRNFPTLVAIAQALADDWESLAQSALVTLQRAAIGFAIAVGVMLPLGVVLGRIRWLGDLVEPVLEFLRPLPPIAVVPLAMMLLGIGGEAKLVVIVFGASFPIIINAIDAVRNQDPMQARVARSLRLTTVERMALVDLPAALPQIFAGIRLSISISWLLAVVSEIILSTDGLGAYLLAAQSSFEVAPGFAGIFVIAAVSVLVNSATLHISRRLLAWNLQRSALVERGI